MARLSTRKGLEFLIDEEDLLRVSERLWSFHGSTGYLVSRIKGTNRNEYLHRFITGAIKGQYVDHINHDKLDNRRSNLRLCTNSQNMQNCGKRKSNKSGYKGVWLNKANGWWYASVRKDYKSYHVGHFRTAEEAARAYDLKALELHGEFASLNFPQEVPYSVT